MKRPVVCCLLLFETLFFPHGAINHLEPPTGCLHKHQPGDVVTGDQAHKLGGFSWSFCRIIYLLFVVWALQQEMLPPLVQDAQ